MDAMFAREITLSLRPDSKTSFTITMEKDVLPVLRRQSGFKDGIAFLSQDGSEGVGISLWDTQASADAYDQKSYGKVREALMRVSSAAPTLRSYEVSNSTWHKIAAI